MTASERRSARIERDLALTPNQRVDALIARRFARDAADFRAAARAFVAAGRDASDECTIQDFVVARYGARVRSAEKRSQDADVCAEWAYYIDGLTAALAALRP